MPYVRVDGIRLYYEEHGQGPPLLLIEGLGYATWMWDRQLPELSRHFRVIAFDNRGVGRSDKPPGPYTITGMADDAAGLLERLGIPRAHVLGVSMGGMIAQELALRHPQRVDRLVLACTHFGGADYVPTPPENLALLGTPTQERTEEALRRAMAVAFAPGWAEAHPEEFDRWIARRLEWLPPHEAWASQAQAVAGHDTAGRLHRIAAPTLVCHGDQDRVVPVENGHLLAARIPGARLELFPGGGHLFFIEQAERFNRTVIRFLRGEAV